MIMVEFITYSFFFVHIRLGDYLGFSLGLERRNRKGRGRGIYSRGEEEKRRMEA